MPPGNSFPQNRVYRTPAQTLERHVQMENEHNLEGVLQTFRNTAHMTTRRGANTIKGLMGFASFMSN